MQLIFVYNARPGLLNGMIDSIHKALSPSTYPCGLCALTYGHFTMRPDWKAWLDALPLPHAFIYRAAFREAWPSAAKWALPLVALEADGRLEPVLQAAEFNRMNSLDDLIRMLDERLSALGVNRGKLQHL
jgi:hypothetical protein